METQPFWVHLLGPLDLKATAKLYIFCSSDSSQMNRKELDREPVQSPRN